MNDRWVRGLLYLLLWTAWLIGCSGPETGPPANPAPKPTEGPTAETGPAPQSP